MYRGAEVVVGNRPAWQATSDMLITVAPISAARRTACARVWVVPYPSGMASGPLSRPAPFFWK